MQRKLKDRLPIRGLSFETRQRTGKRFEVKVVDGILNLIKPKAHLFLVDMLDSIVKTVALNLVVLTRQPS